MNEEDNVVSDNSNTENDLEINLEEGEPNTPTEDVESLKAKLAKAEELAKNYKIRAEKAEGRTDKKEQPKAETKDNNIVLSQRDVIVLAKADIHEEDIDEVISFAKFKNIKIEDALKSSVLRTIISEKEQERKTAQATQIKGQSRGQKPSNDSILTDAFKGKLPENDEEIARLAEARLKDRIKTK